METIGIRDLKAHASHILRRVRETGAAYTVTHHGRAVARITPPDDTAPEHATVASDPAYAWLAGRHWTDAQYLLFANDQNAFIELSDGKVRVHAMPTPRHQTIVFDLAVGLRASALGKVFIAPLPVRLGPGKFREPDVMFFLHDHLHRVGEQNADPPDVAIEVLSPSTRPLDLVDKPEEYAAAGIGEYWIVDPEARDVSVYRLRDSRYTLLGRFREGEAVKSEVIGDVQLGLDALFA